MDSWRSRRRSCLVLWSREFLEAVWTLGMRSCQEEQEGGQVDEGGVGQAAGEAGGGALPQGGGPQGVRAESSQGDVPVHSGEQDGLRHVANCFSLNRFIFLVILYDLTIVQT